MPREPNPKIEQVKQLFLKGYKFIDIAAELGVPEGTIRSWKIRYNWEGDQDATLQRKRVLLRKIQIKQLFI